MKIEIICMTTLHDPEEKMHSENVYITQLKKQKNDRICNKTHNSTKTMWSRNEVCKWILNSESMHFLRLTSWHYIKQSFSCCFSRLLIRSYRFLFSPAFFWVIAYGRGNPVSWGIQVFFLLRFLTLDWLIYYGSEQKHCAMRRNMNTRIACFI